MNLDTLFFLVKGDTKDAEQALTRVDKKADEAEKSLGKVGSGFATLAGKVGGAIGGFMAVSYLKGQFMETADAGQRLNEVASRMGVDVGDLDAWSKSIEDAGGSAESFQGSLKGLAANIEMFKVKGSSRAHPFFQELGIDESKVKNVMELLPQLADKFSKMTEQEAQGQGQKLGLDEVTIGVLQKGRAELDKLIARQKVFGVITKEDGELLDNFDSAMDELFRTGQMLWRGLVMGLLPAFTMIGEAIKETILFFKDHEGALGVFAGGLLVFSAIAASIFIPTIWAMTAAWLKQAAAAALAWLPIAAIIAVVLALSAAVMLLYDDFKTWTEGGDSLLGRHLGKWQDFKTKVIGWIDEIKMKWDNFKQFFSDMGTNAKALFTGQGFDFEKAGEGAKSAGSDFSDTMYNKTPLGWAIQKGMQAFDIGNSTPLSAEGRVPGNTSKEQTNSVQTGPITINTQATDAGGVAQGLGDKLSSLMKDAMASFDDGVAA